MPIARLIATSLFAIAATCGSGAANAAAGTAPGGFASAQAEPAPPATIPLARLPAEMQAWAREQRNICRDAGGRVTTESFAPLTADFNGDGRTDYVIGPSETFECSAGLMVYMAGQVPTYDFFVSAARGYRLVESVTSAEPIAIETFEGRQVARVSAGGPGAFERPYWEFLYGWDGRDMAELAFFDAERRRVNSDGSLLGGGGWERVDFLPEGYPEGFYAQDCREAARDQDGMGFLYLTRRGWGEWDGTSRIDRIERNGAVRYRFHLSIEDEEGNATPVVVNVETGRFGEFSLLYEGEEPKHYASCEDRLVPAQVRRDMTGR